MTDWGSKFARVVALFRRFHEREPKQGEIAEIRSDEPVMLIGQLDTIRYRVAGESKLWEHCFAKSSRPLLFSSSDGQRVFIVKGRWRFTERGFVNR